MILSGISPVAPSTVRSNPVTLPSSSTSSIAIRLGGTSIVIAPSEYLYIREILRIISDNFPCQDSLPGAPRAALLRDCGHGGGDSRNRRSEGLAAPQGIPEGRKSAGLKRRRVLGSEAMLQLPRLLALHWSVNREVHPASHFYLIILWTS